MPKEQKLLKQMLDSLNKQPEYEPAHENDTNPQQNIEKTDETSIPLRTFDEIVKEYSNTKPNHEE
jgi:hypothetical protein